MIQLRDQTQAYIYATDCHVSDRQQLLRRGDPVVYEHGQRPLLHGGQTKHTRLHGPRVCAAVLHKRCRQ